MYIKVDGWIRTDKYIDSLEEIYNQTDNCFFRYVERLFERLKDSWTYGHFKIMIL